MMKITYSSHAVNRMIQREISTVEVAALLRNPNGIVQQSRNKSIYYKYLDGRNDNNIAAVVVKITKNAYLVITVMINFEVNK